MSPNTNSNTFSLNTIEGISINGSGGDYLSNEIFYRIARSRTKYASTVKTGHYHIANPNGYIPRDIVDRHPELVKIVTPIRHSLVDVIKEVSNTVKRVINDI